MTQARLSKLRQQIGNYGFADDHLAVGSTLGSPKICMVIKATGAIEKVYSIDAGEVLVGTLVVHHWDERTGVALAPLRGNFVIEPERQEHHFQLSNQVAVKETLFVLNAAEENNVADPPAAYYVLELHNDSGDDAHIASYAFCQLRGHMPHDVRTDYDSRLNGILAWNESRPEHVRIFATSVAPTTYEVTWDHAKAISGHCPGPLSGEVDQAFSDPLAVFHHSHSMKPRERVRIQYTLTFSCDGSRAAKRVYRSVCDAGASLERTGRHYSEILDRSVVVTPAADVNRGVLWAKANMLRTELRAPTGYCFVNDPTRSNNSVARDTAWFSFGADYLTPDFARESLLAYVDRQEKSGMIVEYYDVRTGESADYGLNVNDNTPLLVLGLWHHFNTTGDEAFLERVYPHAVRAGRFLLSQRNDDGLVWCSSTQTKERGIVGWRNVIADYRLSGATTELNSEAYAALNKIAHMARILEKHDESAEFAQRASELREAINRRLYNAANGLYYLNIDVDGQPRSDITSDLVFPVMFGVADDEVAAHIISRLSAEDFWTDAGIRTVPRAAPQYGPTHGYGLLGGVWVGVTFWFAFAAAKFNAAFMAEALSRSFRHYSVDPRKNNTVPGQFSEWLHGETLTNQGMMLSPWFPPRYLWAAIEGAGGLDLSSVAPTLSPRLAPDWKWLGVQNVPFRAKALTWFVVRVPDMRMYTNFPFHQPDPYVAYTDDITQWVAADGQTVVALALKQDADIAVLVGNTVERTVATAVRITHGIHGTYRLKSFNSIRAAWNDEGSVSAEQLSVGMPLQLERKGFALLELQQET